MNKNTGHYSDDNNTVNNVNINNVWDTHIVNINNLTKIIHGRIHIHIKYHMIKNLTIVAWYRIKVLLNHMCWHMDNKAYIVIN